MAFFSSAASLGSSMRFTVRSSSGRRFFSAAASSSAIAFMSGSAASASASFSSLSALRHSSTASTSGPRSAYSFEAATNFCESRLPPDRLACSSAWRAVIWSSFCSSDMGRRSLHKSAASAQMPPVLTHSWRPTSPSPASSSAALLQAMPRRRIAKVVLYGSRARGDARRDSDWDLAVFINGRPTPTRPVYPISHQLRSDASKLALSFRHCPFQPVMRTLNYSFYRNVRADGVAV